MAVPDIDMKIPCAVFVEHRGDPTSRVIIVCAYVDIIGGARRTEVFLTPCERLSLRWHGGVAGSEASESHLA